MIEGVPAGAIRKPAMLVVGRMCYICCCNYVCPAALCSETCSAAVAAASEGVADSAAAPGCCWPNCTAEVAMMLLLSFGGPKPAPLP